MQLSLYDRLAKLRLLSAITYDMGTQQGLSEEQKAENIAPIREQCSALIKNALMNDLGDVIACIENFREDALSDLRKAKRHREKARDSKHHAEVVLHELKKLLIERGATELVQGNSMVTFLNGKLEIR